MKKLLFILPLLLSIAFAKNITPTFTLKSVGFISDFTIDKNIIYVANDMGTIDIFDLDKKKMINQIFLPLVTTARNRLESARIISVDYLNGKVLILSIGDSGYRNMWIYEKNELKLIIDESKKLTIKEARFIDDEKIIFGTFGSEIILHDKKEKYNIYKSHISFSSLSDIQLNSSKDTMVTADESGAIKVIDVKTSKIKNVYESQNVDRVYNVAYSNGVIITAGQDRRIAVYQKNIADYHIKSDFLVFCVGLSPSGEIGAYSSGEDSDIQLFNTKTKSNIVRLIGHKSVISRIIFIDEDRLFSAGSKNNLYFWDLKDSH